MRLIISNTNHFKIKQNMLWVGVMTFVTVIFWIVYSIYVAYSQSTIDPEVSQLLTPLNPTLDKEALQIISENKFEPPDKFTILVRREVGDGKAIVPIDDPIPSNGDDASESADILNTLNANQQLVNSPTPSTSR